MPSVLAVVFEPAVTTAGMPTARRAMRGRRG
jgi:hypothetical protein